MSDSAPSNANLISSSSSDAVFVATASRHRSAASFSSSSSSSPSPPVPPTSTHGSPSNTNPPGNIPHNSSSTPPPPSQRRRLNPPTPPLLSPSPARSHVASVEPPAQDKDDDNSCPICMEPWANAGPHHLVCLPCGHLFGFQCIRQWLTANRRPSCPTCKHPARVPDLRYLFGLPARLAVVDHSHLENLRMRLSAETDAHDATKATLRAAERLCHSLQRQVRRLSAAAAATTTTTTTTTAPPPSFGPAALGPRAEVAGLRASGAAGGAWREGRARRPRVQLLKTRPTNGGSAAMAFDQSGGLLFSERARASSGMASRQRVMRIDLGHPELVAASPVQAQRRVNALAVCAQQAAPTFRCIAVAAAEHKLKILSNGLALVADLQTPGVPLSCRWLACKPHLLLCGLLNGEVCTYDVRNCSGGPLYRTAVPSRGAKAVQALGELEGGGEVGSVLLAAVMGGVFGMRFDGYLDAPRMTPVAEAGEQDTEQEWIGASGLCGMSVAGSLVAVSRRCAGTNSGRMTVHAGVRLVNGALRLGERVGNALEDYVQKSPFGECAVLPGGTGRGGVAGGAIAAAGDASAAGGVRLWTSEQQGAAAGVEWKSWTGSGRVREGEGVRCVQAHELPATARLANVPQGTRGLFACASDAEVSLYAAGWHER